MDNLNHLKLRINEINPDYLNLCLDFILLFSRFEYALKEEGFLQESTRAMASIDIYVTSISSDFNPDSSEDLRLAIDYILSDPPRKHFINEGELVWRDVILDNENYTIVIQLAEYVRRIRNSLFHGAKFYGEIEKNTRNWQLLLSAMIIIEYWIELNEDLRSRFHLE